MPTGVGKKYYKMAGSSINSLQLLIPGPADCTVKVTVYPQHHPPAQDFFVAVTRFFEICLKIPPLSILLDQKLILDDSTFLPLQAHGGKRGRSKGIQSATCRLESRTEVEWLVPT